MGWINEDRDSQEPEKDDQGRGAAEQKEDHPHMSVIQDGEEVDQKDKTCNTKTSSVKK